MEMWTLTRAELKKLKQELKEETDEEEIEDIESDIKALRKRKVNLAKLLGMDE